MKLIKIKKIVNFIKNRFAPRGAKLSFSQAGEDLIMAHGLSSLGIAHPTYIDIGGHHPVFANNTYLFYLRGGHGVVVEPIKSLCSMTTQKRPKDVSLSVGAGREDGDTSFYEFPQSTRSTFSAEQAKQWEKTSGQKPVVSPVQILSLDTLISRHCKNLCPDIISIDAEGYDIEILSGFSFSCRPKFFCVESTKSVAIGHAQGRDRAIYELFSKNNYFPYAETPANTIFADREVWIK